MSELRVKKARPLGQSEIRVPGDKSISHRSVILGSLANGPCRIDGFLPSEDCLSTVGAMRSLGVRIDFLDEEGNPDDEIEEPTRLMIHGRGGRFEVPSDPIDCGNSGTTMRLLSGLLAAQPFDSVLQGDASLSARPMSRVIEPLEKMGAKIESMGGGGKAPLLIRGTGDPKAISYTLPVASAQVKSAILLAGLFAQGKTTVVEPLSTRDHTERMLGFFQAKTLREGTHISVYGRQTLESRDFVVPSDISSAAFWIVAAGASNGCNLNLIDVGLNPTRTGILKVLVNMGARIAESDHGDQEGEPMGDVIVHGQGLSGVRIGGDIVPNVIDELPIIAVAGALATGRTIIRDAAELRVKETDRIAAVVQNLNAMGVDVVEHPDGLEVEGGRPLKGARIQSYGDHRIAMAFAIAGLYAEGETVIDDGDCVNISYPGFAEHLRAFSGQKPATEGTRGFFRRPGGGTAGEAS